MNENKSNFFDPDDIRNRRAMDQHPMFYWRMNYNREKDNYEISPFMRINNTDNGNADWMDVAVTENHIIRYRNEYAQFKRAQPLNRTVYTREEMMHIQPFREKIEYYKGLIVIPPDNPEYIPMISDFSMRLNPENIHTLNKLDGGEEPLNEPAPAAQPERTQAQQILYVLGKVADKLDALDARVSDLENK